MKKALNSVINVDAAINLGLIFRQKATDYKNLLPPLPSLRCTIAGDPIPLFMAGRARRRRQ